MAATGTPLMENMLKRSCNNSLKKSMTASQKIYNTDLLRISPEISSALQRHNPELVPMFKVNLSLHTLHSRANSVVRLKGEVTNSTTKKIPLYLQLHECTE